MKNNKRLTKLHKNISGNLIDSIWLLETLSVLNDGEAKMGTILNIIEKKIKSAFNDISECRRIAYTGD